MNTGFSGEEIRIQFTPAKTIPIRLINLFVTAVTTMKRDGYDKTVQPNLVMSLYPTVHVLRCPAIEEY
jgi:hypothetical protein